MIEFDEDTQATEVSKKERLTDWKNEPSVAELQQDYKDAESDKQVQIDKVTTWLDNLNITGSAKHKKVAGNSTVVPKLIRKQAEWRYSSLSEPFLSTNDIFNVAPITFEDKEGAEQNQLVLNNQFNTKLNKTKLIDDIVRTAVNEGTVIAKVLWDYAEKSIPVDTPIYELQETNDLQYIALLQQIASGAEVDMAQFNAQQVQAIEVSFEQGIPVEAVQVGTETVMETKVVRNNPTVEICDYRSITIDPSAMGNMDKVNFFIHEFDTSKAELLADGKYTNIDDIDFKSNSAFNASDAMYEENSFDFKDTLRKRITAYEYWGFKDIQGDGVLEAIVATYIGDVMIRLERNPFPEQELPFVVTPYLPVKNSLFGEPDGVLIEDNQKIIGAVTRGMIDVMAKSANGQIGSRKDALDVTNKRKFDKGLDYEFNSVVDPTSAFYVHTYPEIPASAQVMLQLQNNEAESLTGIKAYSSGISGQALGATATGIRSSLDATSKRELAILRRITDGIIQIGRKIISMNAVFLDEEEIIRITNDEFVPVRRDDLSGEFDLTLTISTAEADEQKAQELAFMLQTMGQTLPFEMTQKLLVEIAKLRKMPAMAKDIEEYQPQPDPLEQKRKELEIADLEAQVMERQAEAKFKMAKAEETLAKARNLGSDSDLKDLDFLDKDSGAKYNREENLRGAQARANEDLAKTKHTANMREKALDAMINKENSVAPINEDIRL